MIADQITRGASATEHAELPTRRLEWFKKPSICVGRSEAVHHQSHIHAPRQRSEKAIHHRFPAIVALKHVEIDFQAYLRPVDQCEQFGKALRPAIYKTQVIHFNQGFAGGRSRRSEEQTSELKSLMRKSYAVFCLKNKKK